MSAWASFEPADAHPFDAVRVQAEWHRLHLGDREPCPTDLRLLEGWAHFHAGRFEQAAQVGQSMARAGLTLLHQATCIHANYLEPSESARLARFEAIARSARAQTEAEPDNPNAWFWWAYALGRYSQGISVAKALAQGLGAQVRQALERCIALEPLHAHAHIALGTFHAEVIDKVGALIGGMTYGARKEAGLTHLRRGLALHPSSVIGLIELANALVMLEGDDRIPEATHLYEMAAQCVPIDAREHLDVELARVELAG